ncbi:MAG TPA: hypothetical protein VE932_04975 [Patescibacteria group bacterium]|nr:hypothetical protein [Patescibacteria group bacterium]
MEQFQLYTLAIAGQTLTFTPKAGQTSSPNHLGLSTIVATTVAAAAPPEMWKASASEGSEYEIRIFRRSKS